MVEKRLIIALTFVNILLAVYSSAYIASAAETACGLTTTLINQDPYPAIPGDYVKLVFQVDGTQNSDCGEVSIKLNQAFPFALDPEAQQVYSSNAFYERDYSSFIIAPFKVRVDKEALDGANPIEVAITRITRGGVRSTALEKFNVEIEDKRVDFEIYVKDYDTLTNTLTLEILNIGQSDVMAVTLDIPKQDNIEVKGSNINIVGDLDSNEYTTADFEATSAGGEINLSITYTDGIDVRRTIDKTIIFDPEYFDGRKSQQKSYTLWYVVAVIILIVLVVWIYRTFFRKKPRKVY